MIEKKKKLIYALLAILFSYVIIVAVIYVPVMITSSPEYSYLEEIKWRSAHNLILFISILYLLIFPLLLALIRPFLLSEENVKRKTLRKNIFQISFLLVAIFLAVDLATPLVFYLFGADTEYILQYLLYNADFPIMLFALITPPLFVLAYPISRYIDTEQRTPYPNMLFLSIAILLLCLPLLQSLRFIIIDQKILLGILALIPFPLIFTLIAISPRIRMLSLSAKPVQDSETIDIINTIKREFGIKNDVYVFSVKAIAGHAAVFGVKKVFLFISEEILKAMKDAKWLAEAILTHELVHVRNHDTVLKELTGAAWKSFAFGTVLAILLKNSSLVWLFLIICILFYSLDKWISKNREIYADMVVSESGKKILRALKLLSLPVGSRYLFSKSLHLKRIEALENPWKAFIPGFFEGVILGVILSFLLPLLGSYTLLLISERLTRTLNPAKYILSAFLGIISGVLVAYISIIHMQLGEIGKRKIKAEILRDFVLGFIVGISILFAITELLSLLSSSLLR